MPREKEDFRENFAWLQSIFPGRITIGIKEAAKLLRRDKRSLINDGKFPARLVGDKYEVPIVGLARFLS